MKKFLIFLLLVCFLRLPSLFEPPWYGDEGIYQAFGLAIKNHQVLYRDITDNKPPFIYYLASIFNTQTSLRIFLLFWSTATVFAFYFVSLKLFKSAKLTNLLTLIFLFLFNTPLFEGLIPNGEVFMLLPPLASLAILLSYRFHQKRQYFFLGTLSGLSLLIKIPIIFELLAITYFLYLQKTRPVYIFSWLIGVFTPFLTVWGIFGYYHLGQNFYLSVLANNLGYLSSWQTGSHNFSLTFAIVIKLIIFLFVPIIFYKSSKIKFLTPPRLFILSLFFLELFSSRLSGRPYPHYLLQILPGTVLVLGIIISKFQIKSQPILFLVIFALFFNLLTKLFHGYSVGPYYLNFLSYLTRQKTYQDYSDFLDPNTKYIQQAGSYLSKNFPENPNLFVWADDAYLYSESQKLPITPHIISYHVSDFQDYSDTMVKLKKYFPLIIFKPNLRPFPELQEFLAKYYHLDNIVGNYYLYLPNVF